MYITSSMIFRRSSNNFLFILFLNFFVLFFQAAAVGICYAGDLGDYEKKAQANTSNDFVKVRFNKKIEGIEVSAFWKPSPIFYGNCVLGPAIFLLRDTESNKVLSISANHVSFLTLGELDELGIDSNSLVDDSVLVSEFARVLNSQLDLFFNEDNRAKTQICENGKSCLKFGSSVVDFRT
ncbi:MAG: hypothetical protein R3D32_02705 [Nitratireductor sp.]